jgi:PAS domain-containing protein
MKRGAEDQLRVALDNMPGALVYTDEDLNIVFCNERFREMYPVPRDLLQSGRPYPEFLRHLADKGYYGEGDVGALVAQRVDSLRNPSGRSFEDHAPDGRWYRILRCRLEAGGAVTVMTDITEQKRAERALAQKEAQLQVALDNLPGALAYTDDNLNIVVCNERFKEMYIVPQELLQPGGSYAAFLRYLAENGYHGEGDVDAMVAQRVESLRSPSGKSFEDHAPDGRWYRVLRRRAAAGGTVTVMTDITEQKQAERDLIEATRRTEDANKGGTDRRMECKTRNARHRAGSENRANVEADPVSLAQGQRPDHGRGCRRPAEDASPGDHGGVRRSARLHGIHRDGGTGGGDGRAARVSRRAWSRHHGA